MFASGILPDRHTLSLGLVLLAGLLWVAIQNHLIFHALIEMFIVVGTWGIFVTAWNARYILRNAYLSFIGIAYLFVGLIDLLHILSYKGMGVFPGDAGLNSQLLIIACCMQSVSLVIAPFLLGKKLKTGYIFAAFSAFTAGLLLSVFYWRNFPACFIEGIGPTAFEKISQYAVILFFLASISALSLKRREFEVSAFRVLVVSLSLYMLAELAFAFHTLLSWPTSEFSHFLRLIAVYLMYRVFLKTGIFEPFNTIFRNLSLSEKNLLSLLEGLPAFVFVQMPDYTIKYANRVFRNLFGDPEGLTCYEILKGDNAPCEICPSMEVFRTGLPQHRDWGVIKGKTYAIYEYPYRDLNDATAVLKLGIDITSRKNMETELISARDELENRVQKRTAELTRTNETLQLEITERERVQENLEQSREELRLLSLRLLHAQEMERKRIAMELHDSLGGSLSAIKFRTEHAIGRFDHSSNAEPLQLLEDIVVMLQNLLEEVRRIHANIWPSVLSDFGLIMAINWHCRKFEENYPHIHIEKSLLLEENDAPDVLKIVVYRIIQEALNNVAKHSGADLVTIVLGKANGVMELKIRDNGKGFDVEEAQQSSGTGAAVGLSGMRERARLSGGSLEIQSAQIGTEIRALWPAPMISGQIITNL